MLSVLQSLGEGSLLLRVHVGEGSKFLFLKELLLIKVVVNIFAMLVSIDFLVILVGTALFNLFLLGSSHLSRNSESKSALLHVQTLSTILAWEVSRRDVKSVIVLS